MPSKNPFTGRFTRSNSPSNARSPAVYPTDLDAQPEPQTIIEKVASFFSNDDEQIERYREQLEEAKAGVDRALVDLGHAALAVDEGVPEASALRDQAECDVEKAERLVRDRETVLAAAQARRTVRIAEANARDERERRARVEQHVAAAFVAAEEFDALMGKASAKASECLTRLNQVAAEAPELRDQIIRANGHFILCVNHRLRFMPNVKAPAFLDGGAAWASYFPTPASHKRTRELIREDEQRLQAGGEAQS